MSFTHNKIRIAGITLTVLTVVFFTYAYFATTATGRSLGITTAEKRTILDLPLSTTQAGADAVAHRLKNEKGIYSCVFLLQEHKVAITYNPWITGKNTVAGLFKENGIDVVFPHITGTIAMK